MKRQARSCELVRPDLALYARGLLSSAEQESVASHLEECTACAEDAAFSFELEQALRLEASESAGTVLSLDFTTRVMKAIDAGASASASARVISLRSPERERAAVRSIRRPWTVLAAAAGLLAVLSLALRVGPGISRGTAAEGGASESGGLSPGVVTAETRDGANGGGGGTTAAAQPFLMAQLKAALDSCGESATPASGRAGWGNDRDLFGDVNEDGARAAPRQDPFFLNDPYATLFSDMLPRHPLAQS